MGRAVQAFLAGVLVLNASAAGAQTLKGSTVAMERQNRIALEHDFTFLQTSAEVRRFVELGLLVRLQSSADYELVAVSHPYARPAVKTFVERLSAQYRSACGERLVITSLTRPVREQPRNASDLSVHPAGMAVDLRVSKRSTCRNWLEKTLLALEKQGLLDVTRERRPPHYHVALFPDRYQQYVARVSRSSAPVRTAAVDPPAASTAAAAAAPEPVNAAAESTESVPQPEPLAHGPELAQEAVASYRVNRGDSLWSIARRHGTTVDTLKAINGLSSTQIVAGQVLSVPVAAGGGSN